MPGEEKSADLRLSGLRTVAYRIRAVVRRRWGSSTAAKDRVRALSYASRRSTTNHKG